MGSKVIIVSQNHETSHTIQTALSKERVDCTSCPSFQCAFESLKQCPYSLSIVDAYYMNDDLLSYIKQVSGIMALPVLALYHPLRQSDKLILLENGATACSDLQLGMKECVLQAGNLIQLYESKGYRRIRLVFGNHLELNWIYHSVLVNGQYLKMSRLEFELLFYLAEREQRIISIQELYYAVWGRDAAEYGDDAVKSCIRNLRKKLRFSGRQYIKSRRGFGYYFDSCED